MGKRIYLHLPFPDFHVPVSILQGQGGNALVEMALTLPVILLLLLATLDLGRAVYAQNIITNAAREGAHYGAMAPDDSQGIQTRTMNAIIGLDTNAVTVTTDEGSDTIRVTVTYQFVAITPLIGKFLDQQGTLTLTAVSTMSIEGLQ